MTGLKKKPPGGNGTQAPGEAAPEDAEKPRGNGDGGPQAVFGIEEAKELISKKAHVTLSPDDPAFIAVVLHQAFLEDYEKVLGRHNRAVTQVMEKAVGSAVEDIRQIAGELRSKALESSLQNTLAAAAEYAKRSGETKKEHISELNKWAGGFLRGLRWHIAVNAAVMVLAGIACLAAFVALTEVRQVLS